MRLRAETRYLRSTSKSSHVESDNHDEPQKNTFLILLSRFACRECSLNVQQIDNSKSYFNSASVGDSPKDNSC